MNPDFVFLMVNYGLMTNGQRLPHNFFVVQRKKNQMLRLLTKDIATNNKSPLCWHTKGFIFGSQRKLTEVIMKHFKVCINYGRKCAA